MDHLWRRTDKKFKNVIVKFKNKCYTIHGSFFVCEFVWLRNLYNTT